MGATVYLRFDDAAATLRQTLRRPPEDTSPVRAQGSQNAARTRRRLFARTEPDLRDMRPRGSHQKLEKRAHTCRSTPTTRLEPALMAGEQRPRICRART